MLIAAADDDVYMYITVFEADGRWLILLLTQHETGVILVFEKFMMHAFV